MKTCDGVLLPGSPADVDPEKYGAERHPKTAAADSLRDNTDELLLQDAYNMRKPVFGICYGLQSLNVWRTGTLDAGICRTGMKHNAGRKVTQAHRVADRPGFDAGGNFARCRRVCLAPGERSTDDSGELQPSSGGGDGRRWIAAGRVVSRGWRERSGRRYVARSLRAGRAMASRAHLATAIRRRARCFVPSSRPPPRGTSGWRTSSRTSSRWREKALNHRDTEAQSRFGRGTAFQNSDGQAQGLTADPFAILAFRSVALWLSWLHPCLCVSVVNTLPFQLL